LVAIWRKDRQANMNKYITSRIVKADKVLGTTEECPKILFPTLLLALGGWLS
jgi:hypothetical protein